MKKILLILLLLLFWPIYSYSSCINGNIYNIMGQMNNSAGDPVTGKILSEVRFDFFYTDGTTSLNNNAIAEMGLGWYRYTYTSNGKSGVYTMKDSTATHKNYHNFLDIHCNAQEKTKTVSMVTASTGNSSTWRIPIDETSVIAVSNNYIGTYLICNTEIREVVATVNGTPDLIIIEPGRPFLSAPASTICQIIWK